MVFVLGVFYDPIPISTNGFGIGIDEQPVSSAVAIAKKIISTAILGQFFNFEIPSLNLYNFTLYKSFREAFPATP